MEQWRSSKQYCLKAALAESYANNMDPTRKVVYDGRIVPLNPVRMHNYETDVLFIHGQQSHCFHTWKILKPVSRTEYELEELWPAKLLSDKHKSRLVTTNYPVIIIMHNRFSPGKSR